MADLRKLIFTLMFFVFAAGCSGQGKHSEGLLLSDLDDAAAEGVADEAMDAGSGTAAEDSGIVKEADCQRDSQKSEIYVQVAGAVKNPGVYALPEGSRVFQAVELAGGMTEDADIRSVNQAQLLSDGEMIVVLFEGETANQAAEEKGSSADDGKVNLNTATEEELMELPGIGAAKAASIIAWREANGSFAQIEDLMKIEGIKEGVFSKIKDYVKI